MPAYTPTEDEMDSSYSKSEVTPPVEEPETETESVDEENAGAAEILISKKELPSGVKAGDTCTFKVVKDFGEECSLQYVKKPAESAEPTSENLEATTESEIGALDTGEQ
jgi:hypothetical protein